MDASSITGPQRIAASSSKVIPMAQESEPASRRSGPNSSKRGRGAEELQPRKVTRTHYDNYNGISGKDLENMVGAWRLGKVLDNASSRKESFAGGVRDTSFQVTLNVNVSFMDWRALRRNLGLNFIGSEHTGDEGWSSGELHDDNRIMQWPTNFSNNTDENIPIDPGENKLSQQQSYKREVEDKAAKDKAAEDKDTEYNKAPPNNVSSSAVGGRLPVRVAASPVAPMVPKPVAPVAIGVSPVAAPATVPDAAPATAPTAAPATVPAAAPATVPTAAPATAPAAAPATVPAAAHAAHTGTPVVSTNKTSGRKSTAPPTKPINDPEQPVGSGTSAEDVMASIFGTTSTSTQEYTPEKEVSKGAKKFTRRNRDR